MNCLCAEIFFCLIAYQANDVLNKNRIDKINKEYRQPMQSLINDRRNDAIPAIRDPII